MSKNQNDGSPAENGYNGYVSPEMITAVSWEAAGLIHGVARLEIHVRDGRLARFTTGRERSHVSAADKPGAAGGVNDK